MTERNGSVMPSGKPEGGRIKKSEKDSPTLNPEEDGGRRSYRLMMEAETK
jgi:hypothetical protein